MFTPQGCAPERCLQFQGANSLGDLSVPRVRSTKERSEETRAEKFWLDSSKGLGFRAYVRLSVWVVF